MNLGIVSSRIPRGPLGALLAGAPGGIPGAGPGGLVSCGFEWVAHGGKLGLRSHIYTLLFANLRLTQWKLKLITCRKISSLGGSMDNMFLP